MIMSVYAHHERKLTCYVHVQRHRFVVDVITLNSILYLLELTRLYFLFPYQS